MKQHFLTKILFLLGAFSLVANGITAKEDPDRLFWSETRKISIDDFGIKSTSAKEGLSAASFEVEYAVSGFNFLRKNFNKKVKHYMVRSTSQIVINDNTDAYLQYQQAIFDLQEIAIRQLRKALRDNRKKLLFTAKILDELKEQIIDVDLVHRQTEYNNQTNQGKDSVKQKEWEDLIKKELKELEEYAYDN